MKQVLVTKQVRHAAPSFEGWPPFDILSGSEVVGNKSQDTNFWAVEFDEFTVENYLV